MSREQRQALDEVLRKAPQPFGPVPGHALRPVTPGHRAGRNGTEEKGSS